MRKIFLPDLFSSSSPEWHPLREDLGSVFVAIEKSINISNFKILGNPQQSGSLGVNSSNFKLSTSHGIFLLKRWSSNANQTEIENALSLMDFLASNKIPVPLPICFRKDRALLSIDSTSYSLFSFVEGGYFSGDGSQLESVAKAIGSLTEVLSALPSQISLNVGPSHLTAEDDGLLQRIGGKRHEWHELFEPNVSALLAIYWDDVITEWSRLYANKPEGMVQPTHFDLHPHNLLFSGNKLQAFLDFESCKLMQMGYALGFAGLKLCRQTMVRHPTSTPASVGKRFLDELVSSLPCADVFRPRFKDYAMAEVLRRVCIILRLNYEKGETTWNRVLPIQLGHLDEIRQLFS